MIDATIFPSVRRRTWLPLLAIAAVGLTSSPVQPKLTA